MKIRNALVFLSLFCVTAIASAHEYTHVQVVDPDKAKLRKLTQDHRDLIVDHVNSLGYEVYGSENLPNILDSKKLPYVFINDEHDAKAFDDYPTPEAIIEKVKALQVKYPNLISLVEIGKSVKGRPLLFAKMTSKPTATLPEFKYVANMHGDEIVGRELMVRLIEDLASNYGRDQRITQLLDSTHIYIMPSMNPDGAAMKRRFNANGVDLNRSFPDFTTSDNVNTSANREPEIQAMMKFQAQHKFKLSANFHGGSEVVNYPWDAQAALFPLDALVKGLSLEYSRGVPYMYQSTEFPQGITNGYQWYQVLGGMQDWSYHWHNDIQVTIELTNVKWPSYSIVESTYRANRDSLIKYIEAIGKI